MTTITALEARVEILSIAIDALQARLDALAVKLGETPSPEAADEMADLRIERNRISRERFEVSRLLTAARKDATHTLRFTIADSDLATFEKAYEPIRLLLIELREAGVVLDWGWPDA